MNPAGCKETCRRPDRHYPPANGRCFYCRLYEVACSLCGAEVWEICRSRTGKPTSPHSARFTATSGKPLVAE